MSNGSSSPTKIPHKLKPNQLYIPNGNVYARPVEDGNDMYLGEVHRVVHVEKSGVIATRRYMAICDEDARIARECAMKRCHLYGAARWHEIAKRLRFPVQEVIDAIG